MIEKKEWRCKWVWITNKYGRFLMYHLDRFIASYERGDYTYSLRDLIESGEYDCFVDVGSYSGYFALIGSKFCKNVIAFEADPFLYGLVLYNTQFINNIEARYKWVAEYGDIPLTSGLAARTVGAKEHKTYNVSITELDDELRDIQFDKMLIKLDIEGNELKALRGATELLQNPNVHWHIEVHTLADVTIKQVSDFFKGRDWILGFNDTIIAKGSKEELK